MLKKILLFSCLLNTLNNLHAQYEQSYIQAGEIGFGVGAGHYFGDLNNTGRLNRPKFSGGIFFKKNFNEYIAARISANYAQLGYSDRHSDNATQQTRNLSFNSNIWELTASGEFNFFRFIPGDEGFNYTPYVSLGVGIFSYDPFTFLNDEKFFLRPIGTEGQGSSLYPDRKPYSSIALCVPLTVGFKYGLSSKVNIFTEAGFRFTNTDYLDDVSKSYAPDAFTQPSVEFQLQDRSYEFGTPIGIKDRQRGNSLHKDAYAIFHVGLSLNLSSYRCPTN